MKYTTKNSTALRTRISLRTGALIAAGTSALIISFLIIGGSLTKSTNAFASNLYMGFDTGTYVGNGVDNRAITGIAFQPDYVIVKAEAAYYATFSTSDMPAGNSKPSGGSGGLQTNHIKSFTSTGFTVGTANEVNANGIVYHWVALRNGLLEMASGKYTGNAVAGRNITGIGFTPDMVWIIKATGTNTFMKSNFMAAGEAYSFSGAGSTTRITAITSDGFTLGSNSDVNGNGVEHYYIAFKSGVRNVYVGGYTGNGANDRIINTTGFQNEVVMVKRHGNYDSYIKTTNVSGLASLNMEAAYSSTAANLTALGNGTFTVQAQPESNANGQLYTYIAFRKNAGGDPLPVNLTSFKAKADQGRKCVTTVWQTASEINNDYFSVERSKDGIQFESVGRVRGNGNSSQVRNYSFTDEAPFKGTSYYRLRQIDFDGKNEIFKAVPVTLQDTKGTPSIERVWPNPFTDHFEIALNTTDENASQMLQIADANGRIIYKQQLAMHEGDNIRIDKMSEAPKGTYYVNVSSLNGKGNAVKVVKE